MMKWCRVLLVLSLCLLFVPQAQAQPETMEEERESDFLLGPRVGMDLGDVTEPYLGVDARFTTSRTRSFVINPAFDYFLTGDQEGLWALSGNLLYPFGADDQSVAFYGGAGFGIYRFSTDQENPDTPFREGSADVGVNFLLGARAESDTPIVPFGEFQFTPLLADSSPNLFGFKGGLLVQF